MTYIYACYVMFSLGCAFFLAKSTQHRVYTGLIVFFIFCQPLFMAKMVFKIPPFDVDFNINRLYLVLLLIILMCPVPNLREKNFPRFEFFIFGLLGCIILSMIFNFKYLSIKDVLAQVADVLTYLVFFLAARKVADLDLCRSICKAILLVSVVCCLLAPLQFFGDGNIFNLIGYDSTAFGSFKRAMGVFHYEYQNGYMINLGIVVLIFLYKWTARFVLPFFFVTLFFIFQRMNMLICLFNMSVYIFIIKLRISIIFFILISLIIFVVSVNLFDNKIIMSHKDPSYGNLSSGLLKDTVTGRFIQYQIVGKMMVDNFIGIGTMETRNKEYFNLMKRYGMVKIIDGIMVEPLAIHNGYISIGVRYGIPALVVYIVYLFSLLVYFYKRAQRENSIFFIPASCVLIMIFGNITNGIYDFYFHFSLLLATVTGLFSALPQNFNTNEVNS